MVIIDLIGSIRRQELLNIKIGIIKSPSMKGIKKNMIENIINGKDTQMKNIIQKIGKIIKRK